MNKHYIDKHPEVNGGTRRITKEQTVTALDAETGELTRNIDISNAKSGREPDYVKIYTDCMLVVNKLNAGLSPYILGFSRWMTYANFGVEEFRCTVQTNELVRHDVAQYVGVSDARVKQAIKELVDAEVFIPVNVNGKRKRGIYFVNPWVVGKGEWKDIAKLRASFEFVEGATSVMAISDDGTRKTLMPLTVREEPSGQLRLTAGEEHE